MEAFRHAYFTEGRGAKRVGVRARIRGARP